MNLMLETPKLKCVQNKCCEQWTGMECVEPKKEPLLTEAEFMVVMDDFLKAVPPLPNTPSSQVSGVSSQANCAISDFVHCVQGEPIKVLELLTLDDVLTKKATGELRAALFKVYGQHCTWVVPVDPTQISATVIAAKKVPIKGKAKAKAAPSAAKKK